jgi:hypothetical protein
MGGALTVCERGIWRVVVGIQEWEYWGEVGLNME